MIYIERKKEKIPQSLSGVNNRGSVERTHNANHFKATGKIAGMRFSVYKRDDIKDVLIKLFCGKCAYCESYIMDISPGAVEHFRPKSRIVEIDVNGDRIDPPLNGYYWLAAEWENLLLACTRCNSPEKHMHTNGTEKTTGKWDYFPLSNPGQRMKRSGSKAFDTEEQIRLLINPCIDDPELFFKYNLTDGSISPKHKKGRKYEMALASEDIYGLNRKDLADKRIKVASDIIYQIERVKEATYNYDKARNSTERVRFKKILEREVSRLKLYMQNTEEYAGMARYIKQQLIG